MKDAKKNWQDARADCRDKGYELASVITQDETEFLKQFAYEISACNSVYGILDCFHTVVFCRGEETTDQLYIGLRDRSSNDVCRSCFDGLTPECIVCRNRYTWVDNTPLTGFSPWDAGEPNINGQCVSLTADGKWNGVRCDTELDYVCYRGGMF